MYQQSDPSSTADISNTGQAESASVTDNAQQEQAPSIETKYSHILRQQQQQKESASNDALTPNNTTASNNVTAPNECVTEPSSENPGDKTEENARETKFSHQPEFNQQQSEEQTIAAPAPQEKATYFNFNKISILLFFLCFRKLFLKSSYNY